MITIGQKESLGQMTVLDSVRHIYQFKFDSCSMNMYHFGTFQKKPKIAEGKYEYKCHFIDYANLPDTIFAKIVANIGGIRFDRDRYRPPQPAFLRRASPGIRTQISGCPAVDRDCLVGTGARRSGGPPRGSFRELAPSLRRDRRAQRWARWIPRLGDETPRHRGRCSATRSSKRRRR